MNIDDHFLQITYTDACCGASVGGDSVSYAECNVAISLKHVSTILSDRCECHGSLLMIFKTDAFWYIPVGWQKPSCSIVLMHDWIIPSFLVGWNPFFYKLLKVKLNFTCQFCYMTLSKKTLSFWKLFAGERKWSICCKFNDFTLTDKLIIYQTVIDWFFTMI